jgi:hypothetical protein
MMISKDFSLAGLWIQEDFPKDFRADWSKSALHNHYHKMTGICKSKVKKQKKRKGEK